MTNLRTAPPDHWLNLAPLTLPPVQVILTVKTAAGSGVALVSGNKKLLICDGTDIEDALA